MSTAERVFTILQDVGEVGDISQHPDVRLYDLHLLDSLKTVELMIAFSEEFDTEITPTMLDRDDWATPRSMVAYFERRVGS